MRAQITGALTTAAAVGIAAAVAGIAKKRHDSRIQLAASREDAFGSLHGGAHDVVTLDGLRLHAEVEDGPEPTIVFLHGWICDLDTWHYQRLALRSQARLVLFDLRSHGRSDTASARASTLDDLASDLSMVLDSLVPQGPVVLVGHSMGGMTIMRYAELHPEEIGSRIVGAALVGTSSGRLMRRTGMHRRLRGLMNAAAPVLDPGRAFATQMVMRGIGTSTRAEQRAVDEAATMISRSSTRVIANFVDNFVDLDLSGGLAILSRIPVFVISGRDDRMTPNSHSRWISRQVVGSTLVTVPDAGHMVMLEKPEQVNEVIEGLLAEVANS